MKFFVFFLIAVVFGLAGFGAFGMTESMSYGHGFCAVAFSGALCPESLSLFISHLNLFQRIFVFVLNGFAYLAVFALLLVAGLVAPDEAEKILFLFRRNFARFLFAAEKKLLSWLAFLEQSPAPFSSA